MGETLKRPLGPLPVYVWVLLMIAALATYMVFKKKQAAAAQAQAAAAQSQGVTTSSNLGTVPVSNLTTAAMPMPIQLGDTFINGNQPVDTTSGSPVTTVIGESTGSATLQPANVPQPLPTTQVQTIC